MKKEICNRCNDEIIGTSKEERIVIKSIPFHRKCFCCQVCSFPLSKLTGFLENTMESESADKKDVFCYSHIPRNKQS